MYLRSGVQHSDAKAPGVFFALGYRRTADSEPCDGSITAATCTVRVFSVANAFPEGRRGSARGTATAPGTNDGASPALGQDVQA